MHLVMQAERMRARRAQGKTRESHMRALSCSQRPSLLMPCACPSQYTRNPDLERKGTCPVERRNEHADRIGGRGANLFGRLEESLLLGR